MKHNHAKGRSGKTPLLMCLTAVLLLGILAGAAACTRQSKTALVSDTPSPQIQGQAETSENKTDQPSPKEVVSSTDQGITVTAVQSIIDQYQAMIVFRVEGFPLPEEGKPTAFMEPITIDGNKSFWEGSMRSEFFDGIVYHPDSGFTYADGSPVQEDENGDWIYTYQAADGSLEYVIRFMFNQNAPDPMGKEIVVHFTGFGQEVDVGKAQTAWKRQVEGDWELRWKLSGTEDSILAAPNAELTGGHILKEVEITPLTIRAVLKTNGHYAGYETSLDDENALLTIPEIVGVRTKDDEMLKCALPASGGYQNRDSLIYESVASSGCILDVENIDAIVLQSGQENYDIVPIR